MYVYIYSTFDELAREPAVGVGGADIYICIYVCMYIYICIYA